ncbi:MAG: excalibur calcium-binding domain-containing protein [Vitreimonas sp.]
MDDISDHSLRPGSEKRLRGLRQRFAGLGGHYDWRFDSWRAPWRRKQVIAFYAVPAALGVAIAFGGLALYDAAGHREAASPSKLKSPSLSLEQRHLYAARGCAEAAEVGLAPARRGEPGYWPRWDGDHDGVSCELWRSAR